MKWIVAAFALLVAPPTLAAEPAAEAVFSYVSYAGSDPVDAVMPVKPGQYRNPIISGFHPDPSIVRVNDDYYLVNSSFAFFPGLPVFHSRDLVNWTQIGNAIDRPGTFDFTGLGVARAVFAPTLRYHNGLFYIVNTCIECGFNFVMSAKNPAGPWSAPAFLPQIDGIDLDLFFDDDGRAWIANNGPPVGSPLYDGHRAIWIQELDLKTLTMTGPRTVIVNGGVHFSAKPIWTEGPHIFKRDGWYYLLAAEGGTAGEHSETVYRARHVTGPYAPGPVNPILTQRDLDPKRPFPVYATGHVDLVQIKTGDWWAVFLGTRPYEASLSNMGRETFLLPVTWPKGGWPLILPPKTQVPQSAARPRLIASHAVSTASWRDDFTSPALSPEWLMLRTPKDDWYRLDAHALTLTARPVELGGTGNPSFLARRQQHGNATMTTEMRFRPARIGDHAGLAIFADERHQYFCGLWQTATGPVIMVTRRNGRDDPEGGTVVGSVPYTGAAGAAIRLQIRIEGPLIDFLYAEGDAPWQLLQSGAEGRILASEPTNQFTGVVIGPFAARGR